MGSGFPEDFANAPRGAFVLPRPEWDLWNLLVAPGALGTRPRFGDYAIQHPIYRYVPWFYTPSATIRYTGPTNFHIFRALSVRNPRAGGYGQFRALASMVVADPVYRGPAYSAGDEYIDHCAKGSVGTGNLTTWRYVGTNQHVTFVAQQVPTIP